MKKIKSAIFMAILLLSFVSFAKEKNKVEVAKMRRINALTFLSTAKELRIINWMPDAVSFRWKS